MILPLLIPGLAGSFLLLFVESLADLGNPMFIAGNLTVLSTQIFLAVIGEYDYQKASALSLVLLMPTLIVFLVQRYYVNRRSYISVTGKPTGGLIVEKRGLIRWTFIVITYPACALIILLYATVVYSSFSTAWGVDFSPTLRWWSDASRGVEAILDTTFLSALATPVAALTGMVIAFLIVRKRFSGKEILDFGSNLGGAVPGTILGIGFILAFNKGALGWPSILYAILALLSVGSLRLPRLRPGAIWCWPAPAWGWASIPWSARLDPGTLAVPASLARSTWLWPLQPGPPQDAAAAPSGGIGALPGACSTWSNYLA